MDSLGLLLRVVASLAAVLGLVWMVRRGMLRGQGGRARAAVGSISVLARQQLTNRASVALVQVGGTGLVLGVTDSSVQVLASRPVDELLAQPVEAAPQPAPREPRAVASRPAPRRLLPTSRREVIALPAAPAAERPVVAPVTAPVAAEALPVEVLPPAPAGASSLPGSEPLYEEMRRRAAAVADLPRQESRGAAAPAPGAAPVPAPAPVAVSAPTSAPAPQAVSFDAQLGAALEEDATVPDAPPAAALLAEALPAPADPRTDGRPRRARHGARAAGPLSGSALSPSTWVQAVGAVRDLAGRR
ncbi:flagellar biosynthetic protein FliO [uncultured Pseudokineococcus sp.]|uniref:FliO/MopB family protein n=1 Tax=uncultured Pseudokineococcus sp. TaxID=1642928 RepID=UPI002625F6C5|nr:flagellar biosynthetic protein FliO [uncultured Pseudokineococcus sp.]